MIAVFGASVTAQKNGYARELGKLFGEPLKVFGYGSMHISDAGICFVDKVIEKSPTICFLDWFSTGYREVGNQTEEYIDTLLFKLGRAGCRPIFLFFPFRERDGKEEFHTFCKDLLLSKGISIIDVREEIDVSILDKVLRDGIHTTEYGSKLYSQIIYKKFKEIEPNLALPENIVSTRLTGIRSISVERVFDKKLCLIGNCEIFGFYLTVGPHSGDVEARIGSEAIVFSTWDEWCYFPRETFKIALKVPERAEISILGEEESGIGIHKGTDEKKRKKKLIVHSIYYVGDNLEIENLNTGKRINYFSIASSKKISRVRQFIKKWNNQLRYKLKKYRGRTFS